MPTDLEGRPTLIRLKSLLSETLTEAFAPTISDIMVADPSNLD